MMADISDEDAAGLPAVIGGAVDLAPALGLRARRCGKGEGGGERRLAVAATDREHRGPDQGACRPGRSVDRLDEPSLPRAEAKLVPASGPAVTGMVSTKHMTRSARDSPGSSHGCGSDEPLCSPNEGLSMGLAPIPRSPTAAT